MVREICKFYVLLAFLGVNLTSNAQVINYVDARYQADVNVYFVDWKYQADAVVYVTPYKSYSNKAGVWWVSNRYGVKVRVVKHRYQADVLIYQTKWRYQVKVNNLYKKYFANGK